MGPRASLLYAHEDPWRASAFISVITQLLLTVLVLVHTILVCFTFQLMKWYGWWIPSCRSSVHGHGAPVGFDSRATKKPVNLDSTARSSPLISTERFLKRTRSEDWRSARSKPLVCPKCHGVWTFKQGLSFKYDRGASSQWGETPTCSDAGDSSVARGSHLEAGFRSRYACNTKASGAVDEIVRMNLFPETSSSIEQSANNARETKLCDDADQAAYENLCFKTRNLTEESMNNASMPIDIRKWYQTPVDEDAMFTDGRVEEAGSSSKAGMGDGLDRVSLKSFGLEMACHKLESSEVTWCIHKEMQDEVVDEELSVVMKRKVDGNDYGSENVINGCKDEELSVVMEKRDDSKDYDSVSVIKALKHAVQKERKKLCALYAELEVERIASETAANEAMSMISRLQEEKAALRMQAAHYQRMVEEKANYDEQAMQLLKEILYRKERENYLLEKEVKFMKTRFCKDVRKFGKKRHDVERRSFFAEGEGTLLLKNVEETSNLAESQDTRDGVQELEMKSSVGVLGTGAEKPPAPSRIIEEQPLKRLKGSHENGNRQSTFLVSDAAHFALVESDEKAHNCLDALFQKSFSLKEPSEESAATTSSDSDRGLQKQACEKMLNASEDREELSEVSVPLDSVQSASEDREELSEVSAPLDSVQSASSAMDSRLESCPFVAISNVKQELLSKKGEEADLIPLHDVSKVNEPHSSGDWSHKEAEVVCSNIGTSHFSALCSSAGVLAVMSCCETSSCVTACVTNGQGKPDQDGAEFLQCMSFDLQDHARKDLQTRLQIFESDIMPRSCPSSLNNKGSGMNKLDENDNSLMRSHVH